MSKMKKLLKELNNSDAFKSMADITEVTRKSLRNLMLKMAIDPFIQDSVLFRTTPFLLTKKSRVYFSNELYKTILEVSTAGQAEIDSQDEEPESLTR